MPSNNLSPGLPPVKVPYDPTPLRDPTGELYTLDYLRGNQKITKIFKFPSHLTLSEIVEAVKKYCGDNNFRFVWIEPTINVLPEFESA